MDNQFFDVFISHSSKDSQAASFIKRHLQTAGIRCWKAPDDIMPGESWPQAILRALNNSRAMVLVWSTHSTSSQEVSKELTLAMRNNMTVVPFRIEDVSPSGEWEYHLANTHWMDAFSGKMEQHLDGLVTYLKKILPENSSNLKIEPNSENKGISSGSGTTLLIAFASIIVVSILLSIWYYNQNYKKDFTKKQIVESPQIPQAEYGSLPKETTKTNVTNQHSENPSDSLQKMDQKGEELTSQEKLQDSHAESTSNINEYVVSSGDNMYMIARRLNVSYKDLMEINNLSDPGQIRLGQKLKVPKQQKP